MLPWSGQIRKKQRYGLLFYLAPAAGLVALYLLTAGRMGELGFPLDDAWIHQTYARNLATSGRWEYLPGQLSAGSTSPLWTLLLALGYLLGLPFRWWTWGLGVLVLAATGRMMQRLAAQLFPRPAWAAPAAGLLCLAEWHLVWAAASGMETGLYILLSLALMERFVAYSAGDKARDSHRWATYLAVASRPAGAGNAPAP